MIYRDPYGQRCYDDLRSEGDGRSPTHDVLDEIERIECRQFYFHDEWGAALNEREIDRVLQKGARRVTISEKKKKLRLEILRVVKRAKDEGLTKDQIIEEVLLERAIAAAEAPPDQEET